MKISQYDKIKLTAGSLFDFLNQEGEACVGVFIAREGDDKFRFNNFANGQTQTIEIRNIQAIQLIRP